MNDYKVSTCDNAHYVTYREIDIIRLSIHDNYPGSEFDLGGGVGEDGSEPLPPDKRRIHFKKEFWESGKDNRRGLT